jgi:16S rRNA G966 N2-methylase RsmD
MTRCDGFYEKWKKKGNFCGKNPKIAEYINKYLQQIEEFEIIQKQRNSSNTKKDTSNTITIVTPSLTDVISEGATREITKIRDPELKKKVINRALDIVDEKGKLSMVDSNQIIKKEKAEARKTEVENYITEHKDEVKTEPIYLSACADIDLPENSIDLIFTDPPYEEKSISVYGDLAKLASKVLKPGCFCIAYAGDGNLPQIIDQMTPHLEWVMILNQYMPTSDNKFWKTKTTTITRQLLVFKKTGKTTIWKHTQNTVTSVKGEKFGHPWQQSQEAPTYYIPAYTNVGDTVLDPFIGAGTFPVVCKKIGRKYIGYDINQDAVNTTLKRLTDETD